MPDFRRYPSRTALRLAGDGVAVALDAIPHAVVGSPLRLRVERVTRSPDHERMAHPAEGIDGHDPALGPGHPSGHLSDTGIGPCLDIGLDDRVDLDEWRADLVPFDPESRDALLALVGRVISGSEEDRARVVDLASGDIPPDQDALAQEGHSRRPAVVQDLHHAGRRDLGGDDGAIGRLCQFKADVG